MDPLHRRHLYTERMQHGGRPAPGHLPSPPTVSEPAEEDP